MHCNICDVQHKCRFRRLCQRRDSHNHQPWRVDRSGRELAEAGDGVADKANSSATRKSPLQRVAKTCF